MSSISAGTTSTTTLVHSGDTTGSLVFKTNDTGSGGTTAVTIDTSQNVGIGTTSPTVKLHVSGDMYATGEIDWGGTGSGASSLGFLAYTGGNSAIGSRGATALTMYTNGSERMRIDSSGNFLVGTTTAGGRFHSETSANQTAGYFKNTNASNTNDAIQVSVSRNTTDGSYRAFAYYNAGAGAYKFWVLDSGNCQNTNGSYGAFSDIKLKENIVDASPKLNALMQVKVRNYNLIGDKLKQIGVVAQELEQVFPSMVEEIADKDAEGNDLGTTTKSVKYSVFVPMLVKAIQEQQALITAQAETINALTARVVALESK